MKQFSYDLEIVRGETATAKYTFIDEQGQPYRLPTTDTWAFIQARFKVKYDPYSRGVSTYLIDKVFDLSSVKRFSDTDIINIKYYDAYAYNKLLWDNSQPPASEDIDRLFYHPDLKEYRYYDTVSASWVEYEFTLQVPFAIADTSNLDYKDYVYDLTIEAGDTIGTIDFVNVLVTQHKFTVTYRV